MKKSVRKTSNDRVAPAEVQLLPGKSATNAEGVRRLFWHIFHKEKRAGRVFITIEHPDSAHPDASITVELNARSRGKGIGTLAFRRACELSGLSEVLATVRKGNIASRIATERAGFKPFGEDSSRELVVVWKRKDHERGS